MAGASKKDKYLMKIDEFTIPLPLFEATVRAKTASAISNLRTAIYAEGVAQARQLLMAINGENSVVCVNLSETESAKPLSPGQLKLRSLSDQRLAASKNEQAARFHCASYVPRVEMIQLCFQQAASGEYPLPLHY